METLVTTSRVSNARPRSISSIDHGNLGVDLGGAMDPRSGRSGATSRFNDERTRTHVQTQSVVQTRGAAPRHCAIALSSSDSDDG